jgi:hypothetical protein
MAGAEIVLLPVWGQRNLAAGAIENQFFSLPPATTPHRHGSQTNIAAAAKHRSRR